MSRSEQDRQRRRTQRSRVTTKRNRAAATVLLAMLGTTGCGLFADPEQPFGGDASASAAAAAPAPDVVESFLPTPSAGVVGEHVQLEWDSIHACDFLPAEIINRVLDTSFEPPSRVDPLTQALGLNVLGNTCSFEEPLYADDEDGDWNISEFGVTVSPPLEGQFLGSVLKERDDWKVDVDPRTLIPEATDSLSAALVEELRQAFERYRGSIELAYFDPTWTENPSELTLDDGSVVVVNAGAKFHFKARGLWFSYVLGGRIALEDDLKRRLLWLAYLMFEWVPCC